MKKGIIYVILLVALSAIVGFVIIKDKKKEGTFLPLKERSAKLAQAADWTEMKTKASDLYKKVELNPKDNKSKLQLASLYIQEARVTGDHLYYDRAAMQLVNSALQADSTEFEALSFKSMLYLSEHHFADGLTYAQKAQAANPYNSFVYGLLTDANVELGHYKEAVDVTDKMVSIRPDLRSYSRVSYLREIYGDYPGAIDAMKLAVSAGYPGAEETEWCRIQLGHLYENHGQPAEALVQYQTALYERPDYAYANAGLGRLAMADKKYKEAIDYFTKADAVVEDYSFKDELIDLYALSGNKDKSKELTKQVLDKLTADAASGANDNSIGHYADKELAYVYIKTGDYDKAIEHALLEYNRRPDNIDVNEALAWSYYKKGDVKNAVTYIAVALKTNSQNPLLLSRSALIYAKSEDMAKAKELMDKATSNKAYIAPDLMDEMNKSISRNAS
jgi:tetratricopeptide (TPR) repeat protein